MYWTTAILAHRNAVCCGTNLGRVFTSGCRRNVNGFRQVEYKRIDLQSYEARNGAPLALAFRRCIAVWNLRDLIQCYERKQI